MHKVVTLIRCVIFQCKIEQIGYVLIYRFIVSFDSGFEYSYMSIWIKVFFILKIIQWFIERPIIGYYNLYMAIIVTSPRGSRGSPPKSGGTNLVVIILWKNVIDSKFTSTSTLGSTTIGFLAPKLIGITFKSL